MNLHVELVHGCRQACQTCRSDKKTLSFMDAEVFRRSLSVFEDVNKLHLYGLGETLLHPALGELLSAHDLMAHRSIIKTCSVGPELSICLGRTRYLLLDLDGLSDDVHHLTRTTNVHDVLTAARLLSEQDRKGTVVGFNVLIHGANYRDAPAIAALAIDWGLEAQFKPYIPFELGVSSPAQINEYLMMNSQQQEEFTQMFKNTPAWIVHHSKNVSLPHVEGVLVAWDGALKQCIGRRRDMAMNIKDAKGAHLVKNCSACPVNNVVNHYNLPPRVTVGPSIKDFREEWLTECALDPYA